MVDPRRLLDDLANAELALPELLGVLPGLVQRRAFTLRQMHEALDEYLESEKLDEDVVDRIRLYLPETQPGDESDEGPASDEDDDGDGAATVVAYPQAGANTPPADDDDEGAATVVAYTPPAGAGGPNEPPPDDEEEGGATIIAYPGGASPRRDDEGLEGDDEAAPTIISNTQAPSTTGTFTRAPTSLTGHAQQTEYNTTHMTSRTSQLSWELHGATSPQLQKLGPGSIIKERFILDKVLGAGGMGKVFQARDLLKVEAKDSNPYVAMKVLTEDFKAHPQAFIALQREASRQQKLAHPNIATVYDFDRIGMTGTQVFITMELLVGKPLDTYIRKVVRPKGGLSFEEAFPIIQQLGAALIYAHKQGLVHSDFKPGNAFLCDDGVVKTLDFGIARAASGGDKGGEKKTDDGEFDAGSLGALTPAYASLEMLQGKEPSTQDDLYALACVAYELLTGYHPFNKKSALQAREAKLVPAPIKGLSKRQMKGLLHGLAFEKEKRTATVDQFLIELEGKANWHKNPWVLGSAFSIVLAIAAYNPVLNYLEDLRIDRIITEARTGEPALLEKAIGQLPGLSLTARARIAEGGREAFQSYFRQRINEVINLEERKYDFASAENELRRMALLFPDSAALADQTAYVDLQRNRYLHLLGQRLNAALKNEWLLPDAAHPGRSITEIMATVESVAPKHELLRDPRIPDAYATNAQEAINIGDLDKARAYLDASLARLPDDIGLINTQDRWQRAKDEQQRMQQIAALQRAPSQQPDNSVLLALGLHQQLAQQGFDVDTALQQLGQRLAEPKDESAWYSEVLQLGLYLNARQRELSLEQNRRWIDAKEKLADAYLARVQALEESRRYSLAQALLDDIRPMRLDGARMDQTRERIATAYKKFLSEREQLAQQARITGLQNSLLLETRAREMDDAESTLAELKQYLNERDPFFTVTAAEAMTEAYLELARNQSNAGEYQKAVKLAERGLAVSPNEIRLQQVRERNIAEYNIVTLNRLFSEAKHFDTPAAQRMLDEVKNFVPDRYPDLERQYSGMLIERVAALAQGGQANSRSQAESLATRASILFPDNARLAQLRAQLAPPPWIDGRTARAALSTGRLNEAQGMLETALKRLPDHPEVADFAKDLKSRKDEAAAAYAQFQASLDAGEYEKARERLGTARQLWSDNPTYRGAISTLSQKMAAQRWQGRILQRDVDIRSLTSSQGVTGSDVAGQAWTPIESTTPCTDGLAGLGRRARAICFDMLHDRVRGPLMVVVPPMEGSGAAAANRKFFAISKYEVSNEDYNKYCFFSGLCPVDDSKPKNLPKVGLSEKEVLAYTTWLSERTGKTYRLPTRAEWLHAAGAAGQQPPKDYNCMVRLGGQVLKGDQLTPVSSGHQNGWGLQNFIGNAQELVLSDGKLQAAGASYQDPHAECGLNFVRDHNGRADEVTGFRVLLEQVQPAMLQAGAPGSSATAAAPAAPTP
jgi:serine/threonine protein kinase/tetratricopeptide (TPR) repeat protein